MDRLTEAEKRAEKQRVMTTEPVEKLVCRLALPTIVSMLVTTFYNMADTFFVGRLGNASATGAVGVVFSLMAIIQAVGFFFGHGSGNFISRKLGSREVEDAEKMAATGFFSALIGGGLITLFGLVFVVPLAKLLGSTDTILPYAVSYMRIILCGAPYMCASLVLNNQLRFQGNALYAMIGLFSGAVLNIGLDPLFIFGFGMGVTGAALATVISQLVSFILLWVGCRHSDNLKIHLKKFTPTPRFLAEICRGGLPSLCRQGLNSVAVMVLNHAVGAYGDGAVAAVAIVSRIMMFTSSALIGFGQGMQPVCGFNYGARRGDRVRRAFWFCLTVSTVMLTVFSAVGHFLAPQLVSLFQKGDTQVATIGTTALRRQLLTLPLAGWIVLSNMMLQTMGRVVSATFLALAKSGLFLIPSLLVLAKVAGLDGVLWAQTAAEAITFLAALPIQIVWLRRLKNLTPL